MLKNTEKESRNMYKEFKYSSGHAMFLSKVFNIFSDQYCYI